MDHGKLINIIKQFPQVWDRNCMGFRESHLKIQAWEKIGQLMNQPATLCRDNFKSLREKYVREREKQVFWGQKYIPWQYFECISFLDPHIIPRKQSNNGSYESPDTSTTGASSSAHSSRPEESAFVYAPADNCADFDKALIELVRKAAPIWDRRSTSYPSKEMKFQLWRSISQALKKDVHVCMMRWKGLREKYIRQKSKFHEGDGKWELLDDMAFLDNVIQYRKRNDILPTPDYHLNEFPFQMGGSSTTPTEYYDENSMNSDFLAASVKNEDCNTNTSSCEMSPPPCIQNYQDGYDSGTSSRKRSASDVSEVSIHEKRDRAERFASLKSPEVKFGELVAAMLVTKTEKDKSFAMIEIMKILTK